MWNMVNGFKLGLLWSLVLGSYFVGSRVAWGMPAPGLSSLVISQNSPGILMNRPTLREGSQGEAVAELQAALKLLGYYPGTVDGIYSAAMTQAVIKFQQAVGLTADGIVGQSTWERLFPKVPGAMATAPDSGCNCGANTSETAEFPILRLGMRGSAVRGLQERLRAKGFLQGAVDGVFGPATQAAVQAAQAQYQLTADGVVGLETWNQLMR